MKRGGIRKQYIRLTFIILSIAITVGIVANLYVHKQWTELKNEQETSLEKAQAMDYLSKSINQMFFRARGYYAFQIENELNLAQQEIQHVYEAIENLRKIKLTKDEMDLVDQVETFMVNYETTTLPHALSLVNNNDYEALRELSLDGSNVAVNQLIAYTKNYKDQIYEEANTLSEEMIQGFNLISIFTAVFGLSILAIVVMMILRVINHFILPIEKMTLAIENYQDGDDFDFKLPNRNDEISALSNSFERLITTVQYKNETVTAQNEELLMQQDSLYKNQTTMENALSEARFAKIRLERYNGLNHQLSFTLDKNELVETVLAYFDELYSVDIGVLWLPESDEHALKGYSEELFTTFKEEQMDYILLRLEKEPYFLLKRESSYEKGIAINDIFTYDLFVGIKNNNGKFGTFLALSRIGRAFSKEDMHDIYGLLNRVAQAVDRIEQYEAVNHERALSQNILDNVNEGIHFVSNYGESDKFNNSLFRLLGIDENTIEVSEDRYEWMNTLLEKLEDDGRLRQFLESSLAPNNEEPAETSYTIVGDELKVLNVYSVPVMLDGEKAGTIFVHRDITKEHEVDRMKTELVSTVSHELRTPLSSVLGFSELLLSRDMKPAQQKKYLETIQKEAKRLTNLINDFLDLQRMEYGKQVYHFSEVRLSEIAQESINRIQTDQLHTVTLIDDSKSTLVKADIDRMHQVFTNLLSNAIKFSPDGGQVTVQIQIEAQHLLVSISDEGIGVPQHSLKNMFEKFHRFDSGYSRKIGGTGLGLAICKEIIQSHEGNIWMTSTQGVGTTVFFTIPLEEALISDSSTTTDQKMIMIVEDDTSIALLLAAELKEQGFLINHQSDIHTAFEQIKLNQPACIIIDILFGTELKGWDLVQLLKNEESTAHIPIIISSALDLSEEYMTKYQIEEYLTKPYPPHELSATVFNVLHINNGRIL